MERTERTSKVFFWQARISLLQSSLFRLGCRHAWMNVGAFVDSLWVFHTFEHSRPAHGWLVKGGRGRKMLCANKRMRRPQEEGRDREIKVISQSVRNWCLLNENDGEQIEMVPPLTSGTIENSEHWVKMEKISWKLYLCESKDNIPRCTNAAFACSFLWCAPFSSLGRRTRSSLNTARKKSPQK